MRSPAASHSHPLLLLLMLMMMMLLLMLLLRVCTLLCVSIGWLFRVHLTVKEYSF